MELDVDVTEIDDTVSMLFGEMVGAIACVLYNTENKTLDFGNIISECLNSKDEVKRSMIPVRNGAYIEKLILKEDCGGYPCEVYLVATNGKEYYIEHESFFDVLNLCEFIQTYC